MIRLATEGDARRIRKIYRPAVVESATSFETTAPEVSQIAQQIAATLARFPWLVCERGGVVCGYAYAGAHRMRAAYRWSVETSVYVDAASHRSGVGRSLYTSLFELLAIQGFYNAYAGITLPNAASVALHESMGFVPVGVYRSVGHKFGRWHDVGWWQLELRPRRSDPPDPATVSEAQDDEGWKNALEKAASYGRA